MEGRWRKAIKEEVSQKIGNYAKSVASSTKQTATSFVKDKIGSFIASVGEEIQSAGLNLSETMSSVPAFVQTQVPAEPLSGILPAPTSPAFGAPPPPATIVIKTNESLSFSVNSGQVYKIDWGDDTKDKGSMEAGKTTIVSHAWKSEGDYSVNVSVSNSVSTNIHSFPVRVYK